MAVPICRTCGNHFPPGSPPPACPVCEDPRQYVGWDGQQWTTLAELDGEGYASELRQLEPGLFGIGVTPSFAIGQRALLVTTPGGNVLWDPPGYIDDAAVAEVEQAGGLVAVSASHPHFYGAMVEWAHRCDARIVLPAADREWVTRPDPVVEHYDDEAEPVSGVRLVRCGGHFPGSAVLHWGAGAGGAGALLTGDTLTVVQDRDWISVMWSYPNLVPLDAATLRSVEAALAGLEFDRIYGGWWGRVVGAGAKAKVAGSIERYIAMIEGPSPGSLPE